MIECDASTRFLPTAKMLRPVVRGARLLALNSPLNPTGTRLRRRDARRDLRSRARGERAARRSRASAVRHVRPGVLDAHDAGGSITSSRSRCVPEIAPYVVTVDAISKAFASTGLRVGWAIASPDIIRPMNDIVGHVGAWAPRPEQVASAKFLGERRGRRSVHRQHAPRRDGPARRGLRRHGGDARRRAAGGLRAPAGRHLRERALRAARHADARRDGAPHRRRRAPAICCAPRDSPSFRSTRSARKAITDGSGCPSASCPSSRSTAIFPSLRRAIEALGVPATAQ